MIEQLILTIFCIAEKLTKPAQREPLTERLLGAEKRRNSHLSEKKEKAQVKIDEVIKRRDEQIETSTKFNQHWFKKTIPIFFIPLVYILWYSENVDCPAGANQECWD